MSHKDRSPDAPGQPRLVGTTSRVPAHLPPRSMGYAQRQGDAVSAGFVVRAALQWWKIALPIAIVLLVGSLAIIWYFFKPVYRATAWIKIEDTQPFIAYQPAEDSQRFVQTQVELIRGPLVLGPLVSQPEIARMAELQNRPDPIAWLTNQIEVVSVGESELYQVSFTGDNPNDAALLVNEVIEGYFNLREQDEVARMQRITELLEQERERRSREVQSLRERVRELSKEVNGSDPFVSGSGGDGFVLRNHPLDALRDRLITAEVERQTLEVKIKAFEESLEEAPIIPDVLVEMAVDGSRDMQELQALLAHKKSMLERTAVVALNGQENPAYQRLAREIKTYEEALLRARSQSRPEIRERMRAMALMERRDEITQMRQALASQKAIESRLRQQYDEELQSLAASGDRSLELEFARGELQREEAVHEQIAQRALAMHTEMRAPPRVTLMKRATPPSAPVQHVPWKGLALATLTSLCLPFGIAVLWERSVRRISVTEQLEEQQAFPVVAEIARLPLRSSMRSLRLRPDRAANLYEESVDSLRTCLTLSDDHKDLQVLVIASSIPGEGKTSVASQLAVSLARSTGAPTLLVDADLRSPDIYRIFGVPNEPGLATVLDNSCPLEEAIITDWSEHVHLLPAGKLHNSPHKLLGSERLNQFLAQVRAMYRYVIIDTPPILAASEALVLAKCADGVVVCTMRDYSRAHQVQLACDRLLTAGAKPIGAVLNAVPTSQYASTYGDYRYSSR